MGLFGRYTERTVRNDEIARGWERQAQKAYRKGRIEEGDKLIRDANERRTFLRRRWRGELYRSPRYFDDL